MDPNVNNDVNKKRQVIISTITFEILKIMRSNKEIMKKHKRLLLRINNDEDGDDDVNILLQNIQRIYNNQRKQTLINFSKIQFPIPRQQNFVEDVIPELTEKEFISHFRMKPTTFDFILKELMPFLTRESSGAPMIPASKQLYIALWMIANSESYRSVCMLFGVSYAGALFSVRRVTSGLVEIAPIFITWPTREKMVEISTEFRATSGFPNVIGAIDGTHINIIAPKDNPECYVNRKGRHSLQLQGVCDDKGKFIHCYCGEVGSVHDQRVFRLSEVSEYLKDERKFPDDFHLVGDPAYSIHERVMVPYRNNGHLTERQLNYNFCLSSARIAIERAFGILKARFRSIGDVLNMRRTDLIPDYVIACCVLHNVCLLRNDEFPFCINEEHCDNENQLQARRNTTAEIKRDRICDVLPIRYEQ